MTSGAETDAWSRAYAAPELSARRRGTYEAKLRRLRLLSAVEGRTLDVACGHGDALQILARHGHTGLAGIDLSRPTAPGDFARLVGDGTRLPFADGAFTRVLCLHSLHHFRSFVEIDRLLTECRRVLRDGGRLYLLDHRGSAWLRGLFRVLEWDCPLYPAAARTFGRQLREEHEAIFWWLAHWRSLYLSLRAAGFRVEHESRTPAFFFLECRIDG